MDSAANITTRPATLSPSSRPAHSGSPIVHEAPIIATGARTEENSGKRELFKETTTTALVFPNGGVIRLSAALAPGQLLFLTNQQTKREVVAQVTRKRTNPSAGYYIELEFTEPAPGFWGIEFPDTPAVVPASPQHPPPVELELLQSDDPAADDLSPSAPAPSEAEVRALVEEVDALRAQLRSMQTQSVAANANAPALAEQILQLSSVPLPSKSLAQPEAPRLAAPSASSAPLPPISEMLSSLLDSTPAPQSVPQPPPASELVQHSVPAAASAHPHDAPSSEEQFVPDQADSIAEEDLSPKPALNSKQAKKPKRNSSPKEADAAAAAPAASADRSGLLRLALLAVVSLFAVTVAAWNMHWLPWLAAPANPSGSTSSPVRPAANSPSPARAAATPKPNTNPDATASAQIPDSSQPDAATQPSKAPAETTPQKADEQAASALDATQNPAPKKDSVPLLSVSKRSAVRPSPSADVNSTSSPDDTTAIVPPRLIKSVRAVAPSDALQSFVTGNVTLDALIDKSGHVQSMKVLSGPPSFHKAAMEALKQYRYEPAHQHGQPVAANITVTIRFLFEP